MCMFVCASVYMYIFTKTPNREAHSCWGGVRRPLTAQAQKRSPRDHSRKSAVQVTHFHASVLVMVGNSHACEGTDKEL